jgi:hypothetical protein
MRAHTRNDIGVNRHTVANRAIRFHGKHLIHLMIPCRRGLVKKHASRFCGVSFTFRRGLDRLYAYLAT